MELPRSPLAVRLPVIVLVLLFGTGSWVAVNGLWVQLPLLVSLDVPEGYDLSAYLTIIIQLANVGPLTFSLVNCLTGGDRGRRVEIPAVFLVVSLGCAATLLLVFFWDRFTVWAVDGALHSTALLTLAFFIAIVDCTSSVAFTPFMSLLKDSYLTWYFVGEGLSSLLPSLVALVQGVGTNECVANGTYTNRTLVDGLPANLTCTRWVQQATPARFQPHHFFAFLFAMMCACLVAFTLLNYLPLARREHVTREDEPTAAEGAPHRVKASHQSQTMLVLSESKACGDVTPTGDEMATGVDTESTCDAKPEAPLTRGQFAYLFTVLALVTALSNGALPSIQTYSCAPYGLQTYLLASTMANIANPLAATLVMLRPARSLPLVGATAAGGALVGCFCFLTAGLSPAPPLQHETAGDVVIVLAWVLVSGLLVYTKATIAWILRTQPGSRTLLIWYGGVTQLGSLVGAAVMFPIVTLAQLLVPYYEDACEGRTACGSL